MYQVSQTFRDIIDGSNRSIEWRGTITLTNGTVYTFDASNIVQGSGSLNSVCDVPGIGGAFATELRIQLFIGISTTLLKDAVIGLYTRVQGSAVKTWGEAEVYSWGDISLSKWGLIDKQIYIDIPMGQYLVSTAKREINSVKISAGDFMTKFDVPLASMDTVSRTPFAWLRLICSRCGVVLGMTSAQIGRLPNGNRTFTYADVESNVKTYRDLLAHLSLLVGSIAIMDRWGKLILVQYGNNAVANITPDNRFTSDFEDYKSTYTGIYAQYKAGAIQEYYKNVNTIYDTGEIFDVGVNVFLQISNKSNREVAVQAIIDSLKGKTLTPFDATMPFDPTFDLLDVVNLTGGHAPADSAAPITYIARAINGVMTLKCESPDRSTDPIREDKPIDGVSGNSNVNPGSVYASGDFWILIDSFPDTATQIESDALTTEIKLDCTVDNTCIQIAWTGAYTIDEDATVTVKILLDDNILYQVSDDQKAGNHVLNVTTGHTIEKKGSYKVKVMLREDAIV